MGNHYSLTHASDHFVIHQTQAKCHIPVISLPTPLIYRHTMRLS